MTSITARVSGASADSKASEPLGVPLLLLLIWLAFEFGRPPHPMGIPLLISAALFLVWIVRRDKQWSRQSPWWLILLCIMVVGVSYASNTYAAVMATRGAAILFLSICLPLQALVTSGRQVRLWAYTFILVALYVGGWAALHGGYGPAGAAGGQDENYVAAMMGMAVPFAYFATFSERRLIPRIVLFGCIVVFLAAIALGENPSRGGFLGLCAVGLYCLCRSPRKALGIGLLVAAAVALAFIAGPAFWAEISTTTDYQSGTSDMRLEIWKAGMRMWQANPLLGVGAGNFRWAIGDYQSVEQFAKFGRDLGGSIIAHSLWVEMVAEVGSLGLIATLVLIISTWKGLGKVRDGVASMGMLATKELRELSLHADAIRGGIVAILVNGLFLSLYYYSYLWLLLALGSALPFVYRRAVSQSTAVSGPDGVQPARSLGRRTPRSIPRGQSGAPAARPG